VEDSRLQDGDAGPAYLACPYKCALMSLICVASRTGRGCLPEERRVRRRAGGRRAEGRAPAAHAGPARAAPGVTRTGAGIRAAGAGPAQATPGVMRTGAGGSAAQSVAGLARSKAARESHGGGSRCLGLMSLTRGLAALCRQQSTAGSAGSTPIEDVYKLTLGTEQRCTSKLPTRLMLSDATHLNV